MSDQDTSRALPPMPADWTPPEDLRSAAADRLLERCRDVLEHAGLPNDQDMRTGCRNAPACWQGQPADCSPMLPRLPWIGPGYPDTGVLILGLGAHSNGGLWDEAHCVAQACRQLQLGRQRFFGADGRQTSWFHYRAAALAAILIQATAGRSPSLPKPADCVAALRQSARMQAVQCSPPGSARRTPSHAMLRHCPDLLLGPLLTTLAPTVIAVLGTEPRRALERTLDLELDAAGPLLYAGTTVSLGHATTVVALRHPSSGYGMQSILALRQAILDRQIACTAPTSSPAGPEIGARGIRLV